MTNKIEKLNLSNYPTMAMGELIIASAETINEIIEVVNRLSDACTPVKPTTEKANLIAIDAIVRLVDTFSLQAQLEFYKTYFKLWKEMHE